METNDKLSQEAWDAIYTELWEVVGPRKLSLVAGCSRQYLYMAYKKQRDLNILYKYNMIMFYNSEQFKRLKEAGTVKPPVGRPWELF